MALVRHSFCTSHIIQLVLYFSWVLQNFGENLLLLFIVEVKMNVNLSH